MRGPRSCSIGCAAKRNEQETAQGIGQENVAVSQKQRVDQADSGKNAQAAAVEINRGCIRLALTNYLMQALLIVPLCLVFGLFDRWTPAALFFSPCSYSRWCSSPPACFGSAILPCRVGMAVPDLQPNAALQKGCGARVAPC